MKHVFKAASLVKLPEVENLIPQKDPNKLTETDKLIIQLDKIIVAIKGKEGGIKLN